MKILFLTNYYPPHELGGLEQLCHDVVQGLRQRGHDCTVLTSRFVYWGMDDEKAEEGVIRSLFLESSYEYYVPLAFFFSRPGEERWNRRLLRRVLTEFKPQVVFVWGMWNLDRGLVAWLEGQAYPMGYYVADLWPLQTDAHLQYWSHPARHRLARLLHEPVRRLALKILAHEGRPIRLEMRNLACVSRFIQHALFEGGFTSSRSVVIHNGVDLAVFRSRDRQRPPGAPLSLVFAGALAPHKGLHTALDALAVLRLRPGLPPITLTVYGGGPADYEALLRRKAAALGEDVYFSGRIRRDELAARLPEYDALIFPSEIAEALPRTLMEAMACRVPVITTLTGGTSELVTPDLNGLVFRMGDARDLADQIERLVDDPDLAIRLAENGYQTVLRSFTQERMISEIEQFLTEIITGHAG